MSRYNKEAYEDNKEIIKASRRKYRRENKAKIHAQQRDWYIKRKPVRDRLKVETLTHYGNGKLACVKCGFDDIRGLTLDHVQPIGQQTKRVVGLNFYRILQLLNYPTGYQTLCANCQLIKMFEGNEWKLN